MSDTVRLFGEEYDDSFWGYLDFVGDSLDPRNVLNTPNLNTIGRMGYVPAHFLAAAKILAFGLGEKIGFAELLMHSTDMRKRMFRSIMVNTPRIARNLPFAVVAGSAVHGMASKDYESTPGGFVASKLIETVNPWGILDFKMRKY